MPNAARWWTERVERYVASRHGVSEKWRRQTERALRNLAVPCGPRARRKRAWFARLGFSPPTSASSITRAMVEALRDTPLLAPCSRQNWTSRLRGFLTYEGHMLAADPEIWHFGKPVARKRPYLDIGKAKAILKIAEGRERLIVVLGLFNGLRACGDLPSPRARSGDGPAATDHVGAREGRARRKAPPHPDQPDGLRGDRAVRPGPSTGGPGLPRTLWCHRQGLAASPAQGQVPFR